MRSSRKTDTYIEIISKEIVKIIFASKDLDNEALKEVEDFIRTECYEYIKALVEMFPDTKSDNMRKKIVDSINIIINKMIKEYNKLNIMNETIRISNHFMYVS